MQNMMIIRGLVSIAVKPESIPIPFGNKDGVASAINEHLKDVGKIDILRISSVRTASPSEAVLSTWNFSKASDESGITIPSRLFKVSPGAKDGEFTLTIKEGEKTRRVGDFASSAIAESVAKAWQNGDISLAD